MAERDEDLDGDVALGIFCSICYQFIDDKAERNRDSGCYLNRWAFYRNRIVILRMLEQKVGEVGAQRY